MDELIRLLMAAVVKYKASSKSREYFTENFEKEESSGFRGLSAILQKRLIFEFVWQQCKTFYIPPPPSQLQLTLKFYRKETFVRINNAKGKKIHVRHLNCNKNVKTD